MEPSRLRNDYNSTALNSHFEQVKQFTIYLELRNDYNSLALNSHFEQDKQFTIYLELMQILQCRSTRNKRDTKHGTVPIAQRLQYTALNSQFEQDEQFTIHLELMQISRCRTLPLYNISQR